jgi:glutathione S-transferase
MVDTNITLGYWGIRGRGQVPRLLLAYTGLKWTNKAYTTREEWFQTDKQNLGLPFPNLPYLIDGKVKLSESDALLRYIPKRAGKQELLGKTIEDEAVINNILGVIHDVQTPTLTLCFNEKFEEEKEKVYQDKIKGKVDLLYKFLGDKDWFLGYLTVADFRAAEAVSYLEGIWPTHFKEYPKLSALRNRFNLLP